MMSAQSLESKQQYLRENILEQGFDAEDFMAFCESTLGQIDLEGWSLTKLQEVVQDFVRGKQESTFTQEELDNDEWTDFQQEVEHAIQQRHPEPPKVEHKKELVFSEADWGIFGLEPPKVEEKKPQQHHVPPSIYPSVFPKQEIKQQQQPTATLPINNTQQKQQTIPNSESSPPKPQHELKEERKDFSDLRVEDIEKAIEGRKIAQAGEISVSVTKSKDIPALPTINEITILKTEQKTKNFLQGDYTLYHIKLSPCNHVFQKKFNDFRKLRVILHKLYPHMRLPYLEPEGWLVNSSEAKDPETLSKYKHMIVEFLKFVTMRNEVLKKSKVVRIFMGLMDGGPTEFKKYENIAKPKCLKDLCLPQGELKFPRYESLIPVDKYMTNTHLLLGEIDVQYEKLRKSLDTLFYNYEHLSKSLLDVAGIFQGLEGLIQKFNFDNDSQKELRVYQGIKEVCMRMKETINGQYATFKLKIQSLIKFERDNMMTLKDSNESRNKMFTEYVRQGLHTKKPDPNRLKEGPILVEGNMPIQDPVRNNKNQLTVQNMFWGHWAMENSQTYWAELRYKINQQLTLIAYDELDAQNENLNFWNAVIKKCVI